MNGVHANVRNSSIPQHSTSASTIPATRPAPPVTAKAPRAGKLGSLGCLLPIVECQLVERRDRASPSAQLKHELEY